MHRQFNRANGSGIAIADDRFPPGGGILANYPAIANEIAQCDIRGTPGPNGASTSIAANFHRFRSEVYRDSLSFSITNLQPDSAERCLDYGHHQAYAKAEQCCAGKAPEYIRDI